MVCTVSSAQRAGMEARLSRRMDPDRWDFGDRWFSGSVARPRIYQYGIERSSMRCMEWQAFTGHVRLLAFEEMMPDAFQSSKHTEAMRKKSHPCNANTPSLVQWTDFVQ